MPSNMSFTKKAIRIELELTTGLTKSFQGLACKANIQKLGLPDKNKATIEIMGLSYDDLAAATSVSFRPFVYNRNRVSVFAGEEGKELMQIFSGNVVTSWADFNNVPEPVLKIDAMTGGFASLLSQPQIATDGAAKVSEVVGQMAKASGMAFSNQGVDASLNNSVLSGSPIEKAHSAANQVGADLIIDDNEMVLLPRGAERNTGLGTILVSPETGMIGYPTFGNMTIQVKTFFNPAIRFGGSIEIQTIVPKASGTWRVTKVQHQISAYDPKGGPWETQIEGTHGWRFLGGIS